MTTVQNSSIPPAVPVLEHVHGVEIEGLTDLLAECRTDSYRLLDHSLGVARLAAMLARAVDPRPEFCRNAWVAGYLHDVGKVLISRRIHFKPGPLDEDERTIMRRHPTLGADLLLALLSSSESPAVTPVPGYTESMELLDSVVEPAVIDAVRHHHEHVDGSGYPYGLAGDHIPLLARVVSVADYYVAFREQRCYRPAHSRDDALSACLRAAGSYLDPRVTRVLVTLRPDLP